MTSPTYEERLVDVWADPRTAPPDSCPCMFAKECCSENCTCRWPFRSGGCLRCCGYGSLEQRKAAAEKIVAQPPLDALLQKLRPLVWSKTIGRRYGVMAKSESVDMMYYVFPVGPNFFWQLDTHNIQPCDSIEQGKQLCFADYQSRVRALFE